MIPSAFPGGRKDIRPGWQIPALLVLLTLVQGLVYVAVIPPWQGPDEPRHYEYVRLLHNKGRLVSWADITPSVEKDIIQSLDEYDFWRLGASEFRGDRPTPLPDDFRQVWGEGSHELHQPPLAYLLYLAPLSLLADKSMAAQLYGMRLVSVLLNVLIVLAAYVTGIELFPQDRTMALSLPAFVLFLPQHTFLTSSVNNDHLAEVAIAWMFPVLVRTFRLGVSLPRMALLGGLLIMGLAAKRTALVGVFILVFALAIYLGNWLGQRSWSMRRWVMVVAGMGLGLAIAVIGAILSWDWFAHTDPDAATWFWQIFLFLPSEQFPFTLDARVVSPEALPLYVHYVKIMFISLWGHYGWMNIPLGVRVYWILAALCLVAFVGLGHFVYRAIVSSALSRTQRPTLLLFAMSILAAFLLIVANEVRRWDLAWGGFPQGRYLFPVLIPLAVFFLLGTREFFPERLHRVWFALVVGGMVVFNLIALFGYILPFYYS